MAISFEPNTRLRDPQRRQFQLEGWVDSAPFEDLLGMEILEVDAGRVRMQMPFRILHAQGGGLMHGGALTALGDTAVAMAIKSLVPPGTVFATTELKMEFLAPVREGVVEAEAEVRQTDEFNYLGEAELRCQGLAVARFWSVFRLSRKQGGRSGPEGE